jgi:hypothetical protein
MIRPWLNFARLAVESQHVMALRMMKLALGGPAAAIEARRMVDEKVQAAVHAGGRLMTGAGPDSIVADYRKVVRANGRRLRRL